ncbi:MAG TPA: hypothetical protein VGK67_23625 [Myxococcales bacterium]|jgi:hypothetical protein
MRALAAAACLLAFTGCTHAPDKADLYKALSLPAKGDYDKYRQFLTESQQDRYLALPNDQERAQMMADLHIEERLSRFPKYVQTAIWDRDVVPGMDKEAVLLSWGRPDSVDRLSADDSKGVEQEIWIYGHGKPKEDRVTIIQGVVTVVDKT